MLRKTLKRHPVRVVVDDLEEMVEGTLVGHRAVHHPDHHLSGERER